MSSLCQKAPNRGDQGCTHPGHLVCFIFGRLASALTRLLTAVGELLLQGTGWLKDREDTVGYFQLPASACHL